MTETKPFSEEYASVLAIPHNAASCRRVGCLRCRPPSPPASPPAVGVNPHDADSPGRTIFTVQPQQFASGLERTVTALQTAAVNFAKLPPRLRRYGPTAWRRVTEWEFLSIPKGSEDDEDDEAEENRRQAISDDLRDQMIDEAHAARYAAELARLTKRVAARQRLVEKACLTMYADLTRINQLLTITNPDAPRQVGSKDMLAAQVAADGYCVSCWRDDQELVEITKRTNGDPIWKDRCRTCGDYRSDHGEDMPMDDLRLLHKRRKVREINKGKASR